MIHPAVIQSHAERARFLADELVFYRRHYRTSRDPSRLKRGNRNRIREIRRIANWLMEVTA